MIGPIIALAALALAVGCSSNREPGEEITPRLPEEPEGETAPQQIAEQDPPEPARQPLTPDISARDSLRSLIGTPANYQIQPGQGRSIFPRATLGEDVVLDVGGRQRPVHLTLLGLIHPRTRQDQASRSMAHHQLQVTRQLIELGRAEAELHIFAENMAEDQSPQDIVNEVVSGDMRTVLPSLYPPSFVQGDSPDDFLYDLARVSTPHNGMQPRGPVRVHITNMLTAIRLYPWLQNMALREVDGVVPAGRGVYLHATLDQDLLAVTDRIYNSPYSTGEDRMRNNRLRESVAATYMARYFSRYSSVRRAVLITGSNHLRYMPENLLQGFETMPEAQRPSRVTLSLSCWRTPAGLPGEDFFNGCCPPSDQCEEGR